MQVPNYVKTRLKKWNRAIDFALNPCDATLAVWSQSAGPALGTAILTLLTFGLDDVFRGAMRPKGLYPARHLGRKNRHRKSHGIPEIGEEIGKRLPGAQDLKAQKFGSPESHLWRVDGFAQRIAYHLMVIDIATDFVYDWMNGIYRSGYCRAAGTSQFLSEGLIHAKTNFIFNPTGWDTHSGGAVKYCKEGATFTANTFIPFWPRSAHAMAHWTLQCGHGADYAGTVYIGCGARQVARDVVVPADSTTSVTLNMTCSDGAFITNVTAPIVGTLLIAKLQAFLVIGKASADSP